MAWFKSLKDGQRPEFGEIVATFERDSIFPQGQTYLSRASYVHLTVSLIEQELLQIGIPYDQAVPLAKKIKTSSLAVFVLFIRTRVASLLSPVLTEGLTDAALPLYLACKDGSTEVWTATEQQLSSLNAFTATDKIEALVKQQWAFMAPSFRYWVGHCQHLQLDQRAILPFIAESGHRKVSKRSWVARLAVDLAHIQWSEDELNLTACSTANSQQNGTHLVAVKCPFDRQDFEAEKALLSACKQHQHAHIVEMMASFSWRSNGYLMLGVAEMDLECLWKQETNSVPYSPTWALRQMKGLTSALFTIHQELTLDGNKVFGLHGDIKASNILFHRSSASDAYPGVLKLADFSTGLLMSNQESIDHYLRRGMYGTHQAPECYLELESSRKSDIWSLGCLFLEFIVWLHGGSLGLDDFCNTRMQLDNGYGFEFTNDYFFELATPREEQTSGVRSIAGLNAGVKNSISSLRVLVQEPALATLLDIIETNLLQVEPSRRWDANSLFTALEQLVSSSESEATSNGVEVGS